MNIIARSDIKEKIAASPVAQGKMLYIRTDSALYAYGGFFKSLGREGNDYKYIRMDETKKEDYLFVNYPLTILSESQKYDESIVMKMLNFQTLYDMLFKF